MGKWKGDSRFLCLATGLLLSRPRGALVADTSRHFVGRHASAANRAETMSAAVAARVVLIEPRPAALTLTPPTVPVPWRWPGVMELDELRDGVPMSSHCNHLLR